MHCYVYTAKWLRERATVLRYTYIDCLVLLQWACRNTLSRFTLTSRARDNTCLLPFVGHSRSCHKSSFQDTAHCHKIQHTVTRYSTLSQDTAHCHKIQHTVTRYSTLSQDTAHCHKIQHTVTRCSTLSQDTTHCQRHVDCSSGSYVCLSVCCDMSLFVCCFLATENESSMVWIRSLCPLLPRNTRGRGDTGSIPGQSMWDLWWTKRHWDRFFPEYFGFPLSISFHRCSIIWKN
jgi:hypothetical protein